MSHKRQMIAMVMLGALIVAGICVVMLFGPGASVIHARGSGDSPESGLVAYWKMEEGTGTTVVDSSGHGHDQHFVRAPGSPNWSTNDAPPIVGGNAGSLAFDGGDDWTYARGVPETAGSSQLTVEAWVKPSALTGAVIQAWDSGLAMQWYLSLSGGELVVQVADPARGNPWGMTVGANLQPGVWYHVAFVFDGAGATNADKWRMYVNGEAFPVAFSGDVPTSLSTAQPTVRLGANNFGFFQGKLDEVRIYTVARNSTDILNDFTGAPPAVRPPPPIEPPPAPGPAASPVAYWKMEEGTGTTVVDSSGHGHDQHFVRAPGSPNWSTNDAPPIVGGNAGSLAFDGGDDWTYAKGVPETAGSSQLQ